MSETSSITVTSKDDIERVNTLVASNSVSSLRIALSKIQRRIMILESRLIELNANEKIIKANIYANADQNNLDTRYLAGINTQVNPVQSYGYSSITVDPDRSVGSNKFNTYSRTPGIVALDAEINRINKDINATMTTLEKYRNQQTLLQNSLASAQQKKSQNIANKIGRAIAPSPEDLIKDQIAKSRIANLLLIQGLATTYNNFSTDPETQQRAYPDEVKLPETLLKLRQTFWASANQFHDDIAPSPTPPSVSASINFVDPQSPDKLNFDDPGDPSNLDIIAMKLALLKPVGVNNKLPADVDQFIKDNMVVTNDSVVSRGIDRKNDPVLLSSNSLRTQTASYPAVALSLGNNYIGSFQIPSLNAAIKKWWKKKNSTFSPLPLCPNIPTPSPTVTDSKETAAAITQKAVIDQGAALFNEALQKAVEQQEALNTIKVSDLPSNAPQWVIIYTRLYGEGTPGAGSTGSSGSISWDGDPYIVSRGTSKNQTDAIAYAQGALYSPPPTIPYLKTSTPVNLGDKKGASGQIIPGIANITNQWGYQQEVSKMYVVFDAWRLKSLTTE